MRVAWALVVASVPVLAWAEEPAEREITVPRVGLSLRVPAGWQVAPYGPDVLRIEGPGDAVLQVTTPTNLLGIGGSTGQMPPGAKSAVGGATRLGEERWKHGLDIETTDGRRIAVAAEGSRDAEREVAARIFASLDVRPFANPRIHADWRREWTIEVPEGWALKPEDGAARFASPDGSCVLGVDAWADVAAAKAVPEGGLDGWMRLAIRLALEAGMDGQPIVAHDEPEIAEIGVGAGKDARLTGFWTQTATQKAKGGRGWLSVIVTDAFRMFLLCREEGTPAAKSGLDAFSTFEPDTLAARRSHEAAPPEGAPTDRFERADAPTVVFTKPAGWKASAGTNAMRLVQYEVPGDPPAEIVVFFFGAGGGGGIEANLARWKGMMHGDEEARTTVLEVAEGIRAHLLDAKGTYVATGMGGTGAPLHVADARMLAAVIECPGGPLFVRGVGPEKAMDAAAGDFLDWVKSFRAAR